MDEIEGFSLTIDWERGFPKAAAFEMSMWREARERKVQIGRLDQTQEGRAPMMESGRYGKR